MSDQQLVTVAIALPPTPGIRLEYRNWQTIEDSFSGCYDGGIIEASTDGGSTWTPITAGLLTDPYDGPVSSSSSNPLAGLDAWCGDPQDWTLSVIDLDPYAGETVNLRFRLGTDSSVSREGWYIDDVRIITPTSCLNPASMVFDDGFESGDTTAWSVIVGAK